MLKIRLSMGGAKKRPVYKIVVADSRFPRDGRFIEKVGFFNPLLPKTKKERVNLEVERIKHWISKGARPTLRVSRILGEAEVYPMPPKGNNPLKAIPKKDRKKEKTEGEKQVAEASKTEPKKTITEYTNKDKSSFDKIIKSKGDAKKENKNNVKIDNKKIKIIDFNELSEREKNFKCKTGIEKIKVVYFD